MPNNEMTTEEHGKRLAEWCASSAGPPANGKNELLVELRAATTAIHGWKLPMKPAEWTALKPKLEQFLWDEGIMSDTEALAEVDAARLREILDKTKTKLAEGVHA